MSDVTRLMSAAVVATVLAMPGAPASAFGANTPAGTSGEPGMPTTTSQGFWDSLGAGTYGVLLYGSQMVRSVAGWVGGGGSGLDETKGEDIRGLLNLSDKEFRDFDALIRAAGYVLQSYSFGLAGGSEIELVFDFERALSDRERADLQRQIEQQGGPGGGIRRSVIQGLLDAARYIDASPASGYRLAGVSMRLGAPLDVRVRFRRGKP